MLDATGWKWGGYVVRDCRPLLTNDGRQWSVTVDFPPSLVGGWLGYGHTTRTFLGCGITWMELKYGVDGSEIWVSAGSAVPELNAVISKYVLDKNLI